MPDADPTIAAASGDLAPTAPGLTQAAGAGDAAPTAPGATSSEGSGSVATPDVAATATLVLSDAIADGQTVTIGGVTYRFVDTPSVTGDVEIREAFGGGEEGATTMDNLVTEMAGSTVYNPTAHPTVTAARYPGALATTTRVDFAAKVAGTAGNSITLAKSGAALTISGATFSGGVAGTDIDPVTAPGGGNAAPTAPGLTTAAASGDLSPTAPGGIL